MIDDKLFLLNTSGSIVNEKIDKDEYLFKLALF